MKELWINYVNPMKIITLTTHISYTSKKTNIQYAEILYPAVEKAPYL